MACTDIHQAQFKTTCSDIGTGAINRTEEALRGTTPPIRTVLQRGAH
jgi:hypothetical protein